MYLPYYYPSAIASAITSSSTACATIASSVLRRYIFPSTALIASSPTSISLVVGAVVLFMFALWLIDVKTPKELECVCESCAIECAEECEVCEVRIEDGVRFVSRKNQSLSSVYPIKEEETEVELFFPE